MFAHPFSSSIFSRRIDTFQKKIPKHTAYFLSSRYDLFYFSGFETLTPDEREAFLYVSKHSAVLLLSSFSTNRSVSGLETVEMGAQHPFESHIQTRLHSENITTIVTDPHTLRVSELDHLKRKINTEFIDNVGNSLVQAQKMIKDDDEIDAITHANKITHRAIKSVTDSLTIGITEQELEFKLEEKFREFGATDVAFPTIVAFGDHTALPHHQPTDRKLNQNEAVMIDAGAKWNHYCADVTRTFWFGDKPDSEFLKIEKIVKDAYQRVMQSYNSATVQPSTPPTSAANIDKIARDYINNKGYGSNFIHTTGHGVGLYIHEQPSLNQRNETVLKPGMVITVEPGIYLEGTFGYRFENSVVVTNSGLKELL